MNEKERFFKIKILIFLFLYCFVVGMVFCIYGCYLRRFKWLFGFILRLLNCRMEFIYIYKVERIYIKCLVYFRIIWCLMLVNEKIFLVVYIRYIEIIING